MKKVVFLFSGSGLRYTFHAGVYEKYRALFPRMEARFIGVSGGSVVAAAAAMGMSGDQIKDATVEHIGGNFGALLDDGSIVSDNRVDVGLLFRALDIRPTDFLYLLMGKRKFANVMLERLKDQALFGTMDTMRATLMDYLPGAEEIDHPIGIVATNVKTQRAKTFVAGGGVNTHEIINCVLASCCIPGVFPQQRIAGDYFMDGGVTDRMGFSAIDMMMKVWGWENEKGVELVISDARPKDLPMDQRDSTVENIGRAFNIATNNQARYKFEFGNVFKVKNEAYSPAAYAIAPEKLIQTYWNGFDRTQR